jgi:hypothetical protein
LSRSAYFKAMLKERVKDLEVNDPIALADPSKTAGNLNPIPDTEQKQSN